MFYAILTGWWDPFCRRNFSNFWLKSINGTWLWQVWREIFLGYLLLPQILVIFLKTCYLPRRWHNQIIIGFLMNIIYRCCILLNRELCVYFFICFFLILFQRKMWYTSLKMWYRLMYKTWELENFMGHDLFCYIIFRGDNVMCFILHLMFFHGRKCLTPKFYVWCHTNIRWDW